MKMMKIEETIQKIFRGISECFPKYKIPPEEKLHLFESSTNLLGLGGTEYGIGANARKYSAETGLDDINFVDTVIHELVHYNGFRGHGSSFQKELGVVGYFTILKLIELYPEETSKWKVERRLHEDGKTVGVKIIS